MPATIFTCAQCHEDKTHTDSHTTGYGINPQGQKICFACCGEVDREDMQHTGKAILYLTIEGMSGGVNGTHPGYVSNWPGTLKFPTGYVRKGNHNIAGVRYDVWFRVNGQPWHGVQYGDMTQICHCRRVKGA